MRPINAPLRVGDIPTLCPDLYDGMRSPAVQTITGGYIYKFAESHRPREQQVASPWWFTQTEYEKVNKLLALDPGNVGFIARSVAAVKYEWSAMDTLIKARVLHPICVFSGPGKWQVESTAAGSRIVFQAPDNVLQTYLPGVVDRATRRLNANGERALGDFQFFPVTSGDAIDDAMLSMTGATIIIPGYPRLH